ncbi:alpha/beta hydrolase [Terrarubrum flagellatum]|uniref:alpha/beta hydrolase n=1 Tax=Terrirubrum flagellatum TaxID=2895980 RepID=UPI003144DC25
MIDWEKEYDNRARVASHPTIIARWGNDAKAFRDKAKMEADVSFGKTPRCVMDIFFPAQADDAPVTVFIHGGYWRAFDQKSFSHMAKGLVAKGAIVAVPTYDLSPYVSLAEILEEMRQCAAHLWRRFKRPLTVSGHSAGGHLAAALMATDWPAWAADLPADIIKASYPISALPDLIPMTKISLNADFKLDEEEARRLSPLYWPAPKQGRAIVAVGETESDEYHRQTSDLVKHWRKAGLDVTKRVVNGCNHFTVLNELPVPDSRMVEEIWGLATT